MEPFEKDPDVPFDPPNDDAETRKRWDLDDDAAGLVFDLPDDRTADEEERQMVARDARARNRDGDDEP